MKKSTSNSSIFTNSASEIPDMGYHLILDFYGITSVDLDNYEEIDKLLSGAIIESGATIESKQFKKFEPQGVSILYLLSESHFSIHTWPEKNACAIDFYHCGNTAEKRLRKAEELLCNKLGWENCTSSLNIGRGNKTQFLLNNYDNSATLFKNLKFLHHSNTDFQDVRVYESKEFGNILTFDNFIQNAEKIDEQFTQDLTNLVMNYKNFDVEKILVVGGADMRVPNYLLENYPKLNKIVMVEIDNQAINISKKYMDWANDFHNHDEKLQVLL